MTECVSEHQTNQTYWRHFHIPMNGDAIYYDDDVGGGESISVFDDIWERVPLPTHKHRFIEKLP